MKNQDQIAHTLEDEKRSRREFVKTVGKTAATAPAVAMLLAASTVPARAQANYQVRSPGWDVR